ncbi:MAG: hypothetical protein HQ568_12070 [Calditrichaeota bacterium]|nr:hypothetical protein [Calditrichota bacterium]
MNFIWQSSSDPDWESSIIYRFELTPAGGQTFSFETPETEYHFKEGLTNELGYSWSITAVDNIGLETVVNSGFSFTTNTTPTMPAAAKMPAELMPPDLLRFTGATDPNPADILTYTIELSANESFDPAIVHVEKLSHSQGEMTATVESLADQENLDDDHDYYFRVRATDNHGYNGAYSKPVVFRFNRENDAPGSPLEPFSPVDSVVIRNQNPLFKWIAASDIDLTDPPEKLVYDMRFDYDLEFEKDSKFEYNTQPGRVEFTVPEALKDNTLWFWEVRTRDDDGAVSEWSTMQPFLVNVVEDPPTVPELATPSSEQLLNYLGPIDFKWIASEDIDFMSSITYRIEYGTSKDLTGAKVIEGLTEPAYTAPYPLENTTYYWRVTAVDNTGLETASIIDNFILDTRPSIPEPLTPQPASPIPLAELLSDGVIIWSKATDPNPKDKITYTIQVGVQLEPSEVEVVSTAGIVDTSIPVSTWASDLKDDQVYTWRVKSIDEHSIESDWSDTLTFFYNPTNDNPGPVTGILRPTGDEEVSKIQLAWGKASDNDISDPAERISYHVEITPDPAFKDSIVTFDTKQGVTITMPKDLQDEIRWYWRVRAVDDEAAKGPVSRENGFIYNTRNDPPNAIPALTAPVEAEEISSVQLSWQKASDQDLTDSLSVAYRVELCMDRAFKGEIVEVKTAPMISSASKNGLSDDSWWFWRVRAFDDDGAEGKVSEIRGFTYNSQNDAPGLVSSLISPVVDEEIAEVKLKWGIADDRDISDSTVTLAYAVELSLDENFSGDVKSINTEKNITTAEPTGLTDDRYWFWRVSAVDDDGVKGSATKPRRFILNISNDPPGVVPKLLKPLEAQEVSTSALEWEHASDQDITDPPERLTYIVELCKDKEFTENIKTITTDPGQNSIIERGLADDSWWFWRVRAKDDDGVEGKMSAVGSFIYNTINDPPTRVTEILSPDDKLEVAKVELRWNGVTDKDLTDTPDKLVYRVEFSRDAMFSGKIETVTSNPGVSAISSPKIADNTTWFWRVSAVDDGGLAGASSDVRSFTFNVRNDPPEAPVLLEPKEGAVVTAVSLKWEAVNDPDPFDATKSLVYRVELGKDRAFTSGVIKASTAAGVTVLKPDGVEDNMLWYWRVQAVDDEKLAGAFSKTDSFTYNVKNDAPAAFKLLSPAEGVEFETKKVKLTWESSLDIDPGDKVTYTVVIAADAQFTTGLGSFRNIKKPEFNVPYDKLGEGGKFYWKVSASDKTGAVTYGSGSGAKPWSFSVKKTVPPAPPTQP